MKVEQKKLKRGTVYRSRFMLNYTNFRSPWFNSPVEAKNWAAEKRTEVISGRVNVGSSTTLESFSLLWLKEHAYANKVMSAAKRDDQMLRRHVLPKLGSTKLKNLTTSQIDFLFSGLKREKIIKPKTINNCLGTVKKMLGDAVKWDYLRFNPAKNVSPLKIQRQEVSIFQRTEIKTLLDFTERNYLNEFRLIIFALNTGCRLGECIGLRWSKVDQKTGFASIDSIYDDTEKKVVMRTKGKRFRKVPLNKACLSLFREMVEAGCASETEFVFGKINYEYLTHEKFRLILKRGGLGDALERRTTFHCLRHTFASEFMRAGGNIYELQHILGHSSIQQTERYSHFAPSYLSGATDRVSF